jgi:hypothetical protein
MTTEQPSTESPSIKRPRRSKQQDPQFIFDNPAATATDETAIDPTVTANTTKQTPMKSKAKPSQSVDSADTSADLYEPGDIVWCKLGGFPWWPALIYRCNAEGGIHTKTLNSNNKPKRLFFVYFYGKYLEYSWISTRWLLKYAGLSNFIQHAEAAVQQATTKSEQQELANRYQLKVSMKKRVQWDEAIELADHALTMAKNERIEEFSDLLKDALHQSKTSVRRRKSTVDEEDDGGAKQTVQETSVPSVVPETTEEKTPVEKSVRKPIAFSQNGDDESVAKKKRGRKSKTETNDDLPTATTPTIPEKRVRRKTSSSTKEQTPSKRKKQRSEVTNGNETEYDYPSSSNRSDQQIPSSIIHLIQTSNPPLSNYEQKQIVDGLLHHPNEKNLTFDEAQTFAINKAIEIIFENHNYRMNNISPEWFYETILLKYPAVVFKYRSWFENIPTDVIPNGNDMIKFKQWQIALMLNAQAKAEQQQQQQNLTTEN